MIILYYKILYYLFDHYKLKAKNNIKAEIICSTFRFMKFHAIECLIITNSRKIILCIYGIFTKLFTVVIAKKIL